MACGAMELQEKEIIKQYKEIALRMLPLNFPGLHKKDLESAVDSSIVKRFNNPEAKMYNNYTNKTVSSTLMDIIEYIIKREPILCASGVMFKKHADCRNPLIPLITSYLSNRKKAKDTMFKFPKGSEEFEKYNLLQLLYKIDTNSLYGCLGQYSCILYNLHVAPSITTQARSCISSAGLFFESFLANNVKFECLNEVVTFINNIICEQPERIFKDNEILSEDISIDSCFAKIIGTCGFNYIPSKKDCDIIYNIIARLSQENVNRIYYKNNLYDFLENTHVNKALTDTLKKLKTPYMDPNEVPEEAEYELNHFKALLEEYVYYHHQIYNRVEKYNNMIRSVVCITDTDSSILSLDPFYRYTLDKIKDLDLKIKYTSVEFMERVKEDEFGDVIKPIQFMERVEDDLDYSFYDDEVIQMKKMINPLKVIPQEGVRHSIINIMSYCLTGFVNDYMERYTKNTHSWAEGKECLITMKNEFLFKTILLSGVKKNYASIQEIQEGNVIKGGYFDIKGLAMQKSITNKFTQKRLKQILYEDVLNTENFDQIKLLKDLAIFEKEIFEDLRKGGKRMYKPRKIKQSAAYADPLRIGGYKGAYTWNELRDEGQPGFDFDGTNNLEVVDLMINVKTVEKLKREADSLYLEYKDKGDINIKNKADYLMKKYEDIKELLKSKIYKGSINSIAIPIDIAVPEWVVMFIDYNKIINGALSLFPIEQLGIYRGNNHNNYTNIISF